MLPYVERHLAGGGRLAEITRHMLGLFRGQPGGRAWRRHLGSEARRAGADAGVLLEALARVQAATRLTDESAVADA